VFVLLGVWQRGFFAEGWEAHEQNYAKAQRGLPQPKELNHGFRGLHGFTILHSQTLLLFPIRAIRAIRGKIFAKKSDSDRLHYWNPSRVVQDCLLP
jgi:hypothetical protein